MSSCIFFLNKLLLLLTSCCFTTSSLKFLCSYFNSCANWLILILDSLSLVRFLPFSSWNLENHSLSTWTAFRVDLAKLRVCVTEMPRALEPLYISPWSTSSYRVRVGGPGSPTRYVSFRRMACGLLRDLDYSIAMSQGVGDPFRPVCVRFAALGAPWVIVANPTGFLWSNGAPANWFSKFKVCSCGLFAWVLDDAPDKPFLLWDFYYGIARCPNDCGVFRRPSVVVMNCMVEKDLFFPIVFRFDRPIVVPIVEKFSII